jgi:hypothetical protein
MTVVAMCQTTGVSSNGYTPLWAIARRRSSNETYVKERRWHKKEGALQRVL